MNLDAGSHVNTWALNFVTSGSWGRKLFPGLSEPVSVAGVAAQGTPWLLPSAKLAGWRVAYF